MPRHFRLEDIYVVYLQSFVISELFWNIQDKPELQIPAAIFRLTAVIIHKIVD